jgi:hypothetical protein
VGSGQARQRGWHGSLGGEGASLLMRPRRLPVVTMPSASFGNAADQFRMSTLPLPHRHLPCSFTATHLHQYSCQFAIRRNGGQRLQAGGELRLLYSTCTFVHYPTIMPLTNHSSERQWVYLPQILPSSSLHRLLPLSLSLPLSLFLSLSLSLFLSLSLSLSLSLCVCNLPFRFLPIRATRVSMTI